MKGYAALMQAQKKKPAFDVDATKALGALHTSIANVLATVDAIRKPE